MIFYYTEPMGNTEEALLDGVGLSYAKTQYNCQYVG